MKMDDEVQGTATRNSVLKMTEALGLTDSTFYLVIDFPF